MCQARQVFVNYLYVVLIKTSNASCVITGSFDGFAKGRFEFSYLWFYKEGRKEGRKDQPTDRPTDRPTDKIGLMDSSGL